MKKRLEDVVKKFTGDTKAEEPGELPQPEPQEAPQPVVPTADEETKKIVDDLEEKPVIIDDLKEELDVHEEIGKEVQKEIKDLEAEKPETMKELEKDLEEEQPRELIKDVQEELQEKKRSELRKPFLQPAPRISEPAVAPVRRGLLGRLVGKVTEKRLEEQDIVPVTRELERALLENDVALEVAEQICSDVRQQLTGKTIRRGSADALIRDSLRHAMLSVMQHDVVTLEPPPKKPFTIIFLGFNGTGKTTTIAKVAHLLKKRHGVLLAAGDTFRAASIEQLEEHASRLQVPLIKHKYGSDSAAVIFDAVKHAQAHGISYVLADTAGRSHSNANLMDELRKVVRVNNPDLKILVLDSLTGNDIYDQAKLFNEAVGVDAIILTKADVYEKGGAALSASYTIKKPIIFLGTGQAYGDLTAFTPEAVVESLLG